MKLGKNALLDNEEHFNDLRQKVLKRAKSCIKHQQIILHITDAIMLSFSNNPGDITDLDAWINKQIDRQIEVHLNTLWHHSYIYAMKLVQDTDKAQDIAQSTMMAFLSTHKRIDFVHAWFQKTVFNQSMRDFHVAAAETRLLHKLEVNQSSFGEPPESQTTKKHISISEIKRHLTAA